MTNPTPCQRCSRPSPNAFICKWCCDELRDTLIALAYGREKGDGCPQWCSGVHSPGLIEALADSAVGQVRLGRAGGGGNRMRKGGELVRYTDPRPATDGQGGTLGSQHLEEDIRGKALQRNRVLALGKANGRASDLLITVRDELELWRRDFCETWAIEYVPVRFVRPDLVGPLPFGTWRGLHFADHGADVALWLALRVDKIAASEDAGLLCDQLEKLVGRIEHVVSPPEALKFVGLCQTGLDDEERTELRRRGEPDRITCGQPLHAKRDAIEVLCQRCKRTINIVRNIQQSIDGLYDKSFTWPELLSVMRTIKAAGADDYHVPERTLQWWRQKGQLMPTGWRREDPTYGWSDVQRLKGKEREGVA